MQGPPPPGHQYGAPHTPISPMQHGNAPPPPHSYQQQPYHHGGAAQPPPPATYNPQQLAQQQQRTPHAYSPQYPAQYPPQQQQQHQQQAAQYHHQSDPLGLGGGGSPYPTDTVRFTFNTAPNRRSVANEGYIPFGCVVSPFVGFFDPSRRLLRQPVRCSKCGAVISMFSRESIQPQSGEWKCAFCGGKNKSIEYAVGSLDACRELFEETVEYSQPSQDVFTHQRMSQPPVHVLVVDVTLKPSQLREMQQSVCSLLTSLPDDARIALVTVASVVRVYATQATTQQGLAQADVVSGVTSPQEEDLAFLWRNDRSPVSPLGSCRAHLLSVVSSLSSPNVRTNATQERALGPAVEIAITLARKSMQGESRPAGAGCNGRILVIMGGGPTQGPGTVPDNSETTDDAKLMRAQAEEYYGHLSNAARSSGLVIDMFIASLSGVRADVLQHLVSANGGALVLQPSFGPQLASNLISCFARVCGRGGTFDMRVTNGIEIKQVVGPLLPTNDKHPDNTHNSPSFFELASVESRHGMTVFFDVTEDLPAPRLLFQFIISFITPENEKVLRVISKSLPTTGNMQTFLSSVDVDAVAVLLAKEAVIRARSGTPVDQLLDALDAQMGGIARTHSTNVKLRVGGRVHEFPQSMANLPRKIFMLQRGPLLGPILQHDDDIDALRCLFLHINFTSSLRLIDPTLLAAPLQPEVEEFEVLPCEDLALQSNRILFLDHHTDIFVWVGSDLCNTDHSLPLRKCTALIDMAVQARFPVPTVHILREGDSMARGLVCRLIPAHKDEAKEQEKWFPQISSLGAAMRSLLVSKFTRTDDMSLAEWLLKLRLDLEVSSPIAPPFHPLDYNPI